jgi:hypothetical protein
VVVLDEVLDLLLQKEACAYWVGEALTRKGDLFQVPYGAKGHPLGASEAYLLVACDYQEGIAVLALLA